MINKILKEHYVLQEDIQYNKDKILVDEKLLGDSYDNDNLTKDYIEENSFKKLFETESYFLNELMENLNDKKTT